MSLRGGALTVVKLGGSHASSPRLGPWLGAIAALAGRVIVVPGGGPFADAVRDAQKTMGFGDEAAHVMAMLAMEQYGLALAGLCASLKPARSRAAIARAIAEGQVPVWCPVPMALGDPNIPPSWDVTSDSLALWLAARLRAGRLVLVKPVTGADGEAAEGLARAGIVDAVFPAMLGSTCVEAWLAGPESHSSLSAAVAGKACPGMVRIRAVKA